MTLPSPENKTGPEVADDPIHDSGEVRPARPSHAAHCPRCGYDQRGAMATWSESCPLQGTCTECGLTFHWCEVLRPEKFEPRWCVEFEPKVRRIPIAALRTLRRSFWPWRFWSQLKMSDAIHGLQLAMYVALLLLPALFLYVGVQGWMATQMRSTVQTRLASRAATRAQSIIVLQTRIQRSTSSLTGDANNDAWFKAEIASMNAEIAGLQALGSAVERIDASWLSTTWEAWSSPLSRTSNASIVGPNGVSMTSYPPPRSLWPYFNSSVWRSLSSFSEQYLSIIWLIWGVAMTALLPLSFALMPFSMRRAKVRWAHVVRATAYSLFIPLTMIWITALLLGPAIFFGWKDAEHLYGSLVRYVPWLAIALWWHAAASRYLKIPHAWLTIALLTLMCLLILLGVSAAIDERLAWEMLDVFEPLIR